MLGPACRIHATPVGMACRLAMVPGGDRPEKAAHRDGNGARALVVGGAGYIGSHVLRTLLSTGFEATVFDNLSTGHLQSVPEDVEFVRGDILCPQDLANVFSGERFDVVFHLAAKALVGQSVRDPEVYYRENVAGSLALFSAAREADVGGVVFSSSAATYGAPDNRTILESTPQHPINPYGRTKMMIEQILADFAVAYGFPSISLRYFNAAGALDSGEIGEDHSPETHLVPNILIAARDGNAVFVFGTDYDTRDGTTVRDYVHVSDLAYAHILAAEIIEKGHAKSFNLGNESAVSILETIEAAKRVTGRGINVEEAERRPGDPAHLVASSARFRSETGWKPRFPKIDTTVETAWQWHRTHPEGYGG